MTRSQARNDIFIELYTSTIACEMPKKNTLEIGGAFQARDKFGCSYQTFASRIVVSARNQVKARLHQTEHPNATPATERCPGQPRRPIGNSFISISAGSLSVIDATIPA